MCRLKCELVNCFFFRQNVYPHMYIKHCFFAYRSISSATTADLHHSAGTQRRPTKSFEISSRSSVLGSTRPQAYTLYVRRQTAHRRRMFRNNSQFKHHPECKEKSKFSKYAEIFRPRIAGRRNVRTANNNTVRRLSIFRSIHTGRYASDHLNTQVLASNGTERRYNDQQNVHDNWWANHFGGANKIRWRIGWRPYTECGELAKWHWQWR